MSGTTPAIPGLSVGTRRSRIRFNARRARQLNLVKGLITQPCWGRNQHRRCPKQRCRIDQATAFFVARRARFNVARESFAGLDVELPVPATDQLDQRVALTRSAGATRYEQRAQRLFNAITKPM
jgi:hypothetical protein